MDKTNDVVYYIGYGSNDNIDIIIFVGGDENKNTEYAQNPYNNGLYCYKSIVFMGFIHPFYIKTCPIIMIPWTYMIFSRWDLL